MEPAGFHTNLQFKDGVNPLDLAKIHPALLFVLGFIALYAKAFSLPVVVSSITDDAPNRKSKTHEDGRALDISLNGWGELHIHRLEFIVNQRFARELGTAPSGEPLRVIKVHDAGTGNHIHAQVRVNAMLENLLS